MLMSMLHVYLRRPTGDANNNASSITCRHVPKTCLQVQKKLCTSTWKHLCKFRKHLCKDDWKHLCKFRKIFSEKNVRKYRKHCPVFPLELRSSLHSFLSFFYVSFSFHPTLPPLLYSFLWLCFPSFLSSPYHLYFFFLLLHPFFPFVFDLSFIPSVHFSFYSYFVLHSHFPPSLHFFFFPPNI